MDFVVAGQAFHWFDAARSRGKFARILRDGGWVALVWNLRRKDATPFLAAYEKLLETYRTDRGEVEIWRQDEDMADSLFGPRPFERVTFDNEQVLDLDGLKGDSLLSPTYPRKTSPAPRRCSGRRRRYFASTKRTARSPSSTTPGSTTGAWTTSTARRSRAEGLHLDPLPKLTATTTSDRMRTAPTRPV